MTRAGNADRESVPGLPRRAVLWSAVAGMAAMLAGDGLGAWIARRRRSSADRLDFEIQGAAALAPGDSLGFDLPEGKRGLLVHTADGFRAYDRACPHLGCPVLWSAATGRLECPCHAAAFDAVTGDVLRGPPPRGLTMIELVKKAGSLFATVG